MPITRVTLLERLRSDASNETDWTTFHEIYSPLIRSWLLRTPGLNSEADDLSQKVLVVVVKKLPSFQREREGSFRKWLKLVVINRIRGWNARRDISYRDPTEKILAEYEDSSSELAKSWDAEHDQYVVNRLLKLVQPNYSEQVWKAFEMFAIKERSAEEVAKELGMTVGAVFSAK